MSDETPTPLTRVKNVVLKQVDPAGLCIGTLAGTAGRWAFYPIERASISIQIGQTKRPLAAIKLNFDIRNIRASYKGGVSLAKSAVLASGAYYGLGFAVMNQHKHESIPVQSAWGLVTVLPEQISVVEATKYVRKSNGLSSHDISPIGWARINAGFFLRHLYGNPATFAAVKSIEKLFEYVVPQNYHPVSSFVAGATGVFLTHRAGYSFLVAASVQNMVYPDKSFKEAWVDAFSKQFMRAGDLRAAGRMGTAAVAFCVSKIYDVYFSKDKPKPEKPATTSGRTNFFSQPEVRRTAVIEGEEKRFISARKN